jgi:hypothetical protein
MIVQDGHSDEVIVAALDRHDQRRRNNVPTISVLVGSVVLSLRLLSQWAESVTAGSVSTSVESRECTRDDSVANDLEAAINDLQSTESASDKDDDDDAACSAAERFLFERFESVAETAGLFKLNATLDFYFGSNRLIEVDLAARTLKLAVEVDSDHHFHDPEAFRRDRRKDLELQKHGYLVVRVLADDVVERLEEVMDTILATVAFRHAAAIHLGAAP